MELLKSIMSNPMIRYVEAVKKRRAENVGKAETVEPLDVQLLRYCQYVKKLQNRCATGNETAKAIWTYLVDTIARELRPNATAVRVYFWEPETQLLEDEWALFDILMEAAALREKYYGPDDGTGEPGNEAICVPPTTWDIPVPKAGMSLKRGDVNPKSKSKKKGKAPKASNGDMASETHTRECSMEVPKFPPDFTPSRYGITRLRNLLNLMKLAQMCFDQQTIKWDEGKEDAELKEELEEFLEKIQTSIPLFEEMKAFVDCMTILTRKGIGPHVAAQLKPTMTIEDMVKTVNKVMVEGGGNPYSLASTVCNEAEGIENSGPWDKEEGCVILEGSEEDDTSGPRELTPAQANAIFVRRKEEFLASGATEVTYKMSPEEYDDLFGKPQKKAPKAELTVKKYGGGGEPSKGAMLCPHTGCPPPQSHYRDWKKDGYKCVCGIKFHNLRYLDRHTSLNRATSTLSCDKCSFKANRRCCLVKHHLEHHEKAKPEKVNCSVYECPRGCKSLFSTKGKYFQHQIYTDRECNFHNAQFPPERNLSKAMFLDLQKRQSIAEAIIGSLHVAKEELIKKSDELDQKIAKMEELLQCTKLEEEEEYEDEEEGDDDLEEEEVEEEEAEDEDEL